MSFASCASHSPTYRLVNQALLLIACCAGFCQVQSAEVPELVIAKFTDGQDITAWQKNANGTELTVEPLTKQDRNYTLKVVHQHVGYPGINLIKAPTDWSPYQVFKFEAWAPENTRVELRIDDTKSKGYNSRLNFTIQLVKGRNLIQIPVDKIRKSIDPAHIVLVTLFMAEPPEGFTLHYDNFRLGALENDTVSFIPYAERLDLQPTMAIRTPHFPFGRNLSRGPLKVFAINSVATGRSAVELMQRLDMDLNVVSWDRLWDANTWGIADSYGQRGTNADDCMLVQRYVASSLQSPERFDTMILTTPLGWINFTQSTRDDILRRVEKDGSGLVMIMPFPGGAQPVWTDDLRKVCALVDAPSDYIAGGYYPLRAPTSGIIAGKSWRVVGAHPITDGVPLEALATSKLSVTECKLADGAQLLIEAEGGIPVMAVKQLGKGRVVTLSVRTDGLSPGLNMSPEQRLNEGFEYRHWEVWYDLLARATYWASGSTFTREGAPTKLEVSGDDRDENLSVRQWKDKAGKVTDWQLDFVKPQLTVTRLFVPDMVDRGMTIEVGFTPPANVDKTAVWELTASEPAIASQRVLERITLDLAGANAVKPELGRAVVEVSSKRSSQASLHLRLIARQKGIIVAEGRTAVVFTPNQTWEDFEVHSWGMSGLSYLLDVEQRLGRSLGITCAQTGSESEMRSALIDGFRNQGYLGVEGLHNSNFAADLRAWNSTKDRQHLIRKPSFADPDEMAKRKQMTTDRIATLAKYKPLSAILADETSLTSYVAQFDYDMHPANIATFKKKLAAKFVTVAAMNAALKTTVQSFDEIIAPVTAEAKESGNWGLWNEWRIHNDDLWADVFSAYQSWINAVDPGIRVSVSGTQASTPFNGIDWAKLSPSLNSVTGYNGRFQQLQRLNFHPTGDLKSMAWCGYGNKGIGAQYQLWNNLFNGDAGCGFFWWYSLRNPDLTWSQSARDYKLALEPIQRGIGRQYQLSKRHFSPIAVLWSPTSQRAAYTIGKFEEFVKDEEAVISSLRIAGYDPYFISESQLLAGELQSKGAKALFLPMTLSLGLGTQAGGVKVWPAIQAFIAQKGVVVASCMPEYDEFLQTMEAPASLKQQAISFASISSDLQAGLSKLGIKPWVAVQGAGLNPGEMLPYVHELTSAKGTHAYIVGLLLPAAAGKRAVGADGVTYEAGGARDPVSVTVIAGLPYKTGYIHDTGKRLTPTDKVVLTAGQGSLLALLPYTVNGVAVDVRLEDRDLVVHWKLQCDVANPDFVPHSVHIEVTDAANVANPDLARNATSGADGTGTIRIPLSESEQKQKWKLTVRDVLTGLQGSASQP